MSAGIFRPSPHITVLAPIGRGGMAEVFLVALQAPAGVTKLAVLKRIWPELACDPDFAAMFLDEAKLAVRLSHPHVVQTYEVMAHQDELALSMEYLEGQSLTRVIGRALGQITLPQRLRIVADVLAALEHAHTLCDYDGTPLRVVHRDVSPQNVFLTYDGHVKIMDFGVAKSLSGSHHTRPGGLKGKLTYMAPEQRRGDEVDHRADLYAVGVMLWELLAGRRMWQGLAKSEIANALYEGQGPPPLPNQDKLPPELGELCRRALSPERGERFASAAEMERELARVAPGGLDNRTRALGRVLQVAFAPERQERRTLIETHLRGLGVVQGASTPAGEASSPTARQLPEMRISTSFPSVTPILVGQLTGARLRDASRSFLTSVAGWRSQLRMAAAGTVGAAAIAATIMLAARGTPETRPDIRPSTPAGELAAPAIRARLRPAPAEPGTIDIEPIAVAAREHEPSGFADEDLDSSAREETPRRRKKRWEPKRDDDRDLLGARRPKHDDDRELLGARRPKRDDDRDLLASRRPKRARTLARPLDTSDPYAQ